MKAYIRYDSTGRIVASGPALFHEKPNTGNWRLVTDSLGDEVTKSGQLKAFIRIDNNNKPIPGTLFLGSVQPKSGKWIRVNATYVAGVTPVTTTTTTTLIPTTTTTTTASVSEFLSTQNNDPLITESGENIIL